MTCRHRKFVAPFVLLVVLLALSTASLAQAKPHYVAAFFVDAQHGWLTGSDGSGKVAIWATSTGGRTLKRQSAHMGAGSGNCLLAFASRTRGLWADDTGLRRTTNGGASWVPVSRAGLGIPRDLDLASATVGWATGAFGSDGAGGTISRSTDGGATWRRMKTVHDHPGGNEFGGLSCPSPQICYVLGSGSLDGLWVTSDGGRRWAKCALPRIPDSKWYDSIEFPTRRVGWIFGGNGVIAKTTDGGASWKRQASRTTQRITGACFIDARIGFAVGDEGAILRTVDGGSHWESQDVGADSGFEDVFFVDRLHGWAVGHDVRMRTTDGGHTWRRL